MTKEKATVTCGRAWRVNNSGIRRQSVAVHYIVKRTIMCEWQNVLYACDQLIFTIDRITCRLQFKTHSFYIQVGSGFKIDLHAWLPKILKRNKLPLFKILELRTCIMLDY